MVSFWNWNISCLWRYIVAQHVKRLLAYKLTESLHFIKDHLFHLANVFDNFEMEVKCSWAGWFIRGVVPNLKVAMFKSSFNRDTRGWVKSKHFVQQIQGSLV